MKKLTEKQLIKVGNNLNYWFNKATKEDIKNGLNWYPIANDICNDIATKFNTTSLKAAEVIAIVSPRNKWKQNIKDTYKIFEAVKYGLQPEDIKICSFHSNKWKAFNAISNNITITEKSPKTYNFCKNVGLLDENAVTIDIWHLRACFFFTMKINNASIGKTAYQQIKTLTLKKAHKLGLKGFEYQAIIWNSIRNN